MLNQNAYALGTNGSCIRDLFDYGRKRAAIVGDDNVFDYSIGNPSIPAPPEVMATIRHILDTEDSTAIHSYTSDAGDAPTRQAIAEDLNSRYDAGIRAEDLFMTCGTSPALTAVLRALSFPGSEVVAVAPYFPEYRPFAEEAGHIFKVAAPDIPEFQIKPEAVEALLTANTAAVILNSPNNPTGTVYTEETLRTLAAILEKKGQEFGHPIYIIADEPYRELVYGITAPFIPNIYPHTVVCYSYSKSLSLPGERIGYVCVPKQAAQSRELYAAISGAARAIGHICAPSLWQKVIAKCAHLRPDLESYDKNRKALYEGLVDAGYTVAKPEGAFYLFVEAPGGNAEAFSEKAKKLDLLIVPGDSFGCPGWFRLCYCVSHDKILHSLPLFRQLVEK